MVTPVLTTPAVAGALLIGGKVYTHTSVKGDVDPQLHPLVARIHDELPVEDRQRWAGRCAQVILVSDRLYEAEAEAGRGPLSPAEARAALWGARVTATRIREQGDPAHGQYQPPCRSCAAVLEWAGVEAVAT